MAAPRDPLRDRGGVSASPAAGSGWLAGDGSDGLSGVDPGGVGAPMAAAAAASSAASISSRVACSGGGADRGLRPRTDEDDVATRAVSPARPAAASPVAVPPPSRGGRGASSDASYSATEANTGNPADAASARVAASAATIESRFSWVSASRDSSRKLMRDVATREPYGSTTATRRPSADRMRAAADVISSSISR